MIFYYSGCGNSRHIAQKIAEALGDRLVFIPEAERRGDFRFTLAPGESLGFVWPVYCWAPPQLVTDYVSRLGIDWEGTSPYVYTVMTYGDNAGLSAGEFRRTLAGIGLEQNAVWGLQMPETYIQMPGMNLDSDENARRKIHEADEKVSSIVAGIKAGVVAEDVIVGSSPWLKTRIVKPAFYKMMVTDSKWTVLDSCMGCGTCAKVCPLENISLEGGRPHWNGNCTTCNACYHSCPVNAIHFGKATRGKGQYRIEKVL